MASQSRGGPRLLNLIMRDSNPCTRVLGSTLDLGPAIAVPALGTGRVLGRTVACDLRTTSVQAERLILELMTTTFILHRLTASNSFANIVSLPLNHSFSPSILRKRSLLRLIVLVFLCCRSADSDKRCFFFPPTVCGLGLARRASESSIGCPPLGPNVSIGRSDLDHRINA